MIHVRTTADAVPDVGAASQRALRTARTAHDAAPATCGAPRVLLLPFEAVLANLFIDIEIVLRQRLAEIEARGPPRVAR